MSTIRMPARLRTPWHRHARTRRGQAVVAALLMALSLACTYVLPNPLPTPPAATQPAAEPSPTEWDFFATAMPSRPTATVAPASTPPPPTGTPPPASGPVAITGIFEDPPNPGGGSTEPGEWVAITNQSPGPVDLVGWQLVDEARHAFSFPAYVMQPGQTCRVYTDEVHPEWCGFSYGATQGIWNNGGDCAHLLDAAGVEVSRWCY